MVVQPQVLSHLLSHLSLYLRFFYFLLIRPQQKKQKEHTAMLNSIAAGDEILTTGGMFGKVIKVIDNAYIVEIANGVTIKLVKNGIAQKVVAGATTEEKK